MKSYTLLALLLFSISLTLPVFSQDQTWKVVSIPKICTYQIPSTVEIQKGLYRKIAKRVVDEHVKEVLEITKVPERVVAQQKGINSFNPKAFKRYCRIIVETEYGIQGEFQDIDAPLALSQEELTEINAALKQKIELISKKSQSTTFKMKVLTWNQVKIARISGIDALQLSYTRTVNGASPVLVNTYIIQNNHAMHRITLSYRISEKQLWAKDFDKVIESFKFAKK
jgi:hypothetical protein